MSNSIFPSIYTASRTKHAEWWKALRSAHPEVIFTSRWIDLENFNSTQPAACRESWVIDEEDVRRSDYVLCFSEEREVLRGALVEAGMGIALGKKIVLVGECDSFGTWQFHPQVKGKFCFVWEALSWIRDDWKGKHTRHG